MNRATQFNKLLERALGVVIGLSVLVSVGRYGMAMFKFNSTGSQTSSVPPEEVLARYDGKRITPQTVHPYAELLDELEAKCIETRLQIAGIASTLTKKENALGEDISYRLGLKVLLYDVVEPVARQDETSCLNAYLDYAQEHLN